MIKGCLPAAFITYTTRMAKRNRDGNTAKEFNEIATEALNRHEQDLAAMKKVSEDAGRDLEERTRYRRKRKRVMQKKRTA